MDPTPTPPDPMIARSSEPSGSTAPVSSEKPRHGEDRLLSSDAQPDAVLEEIRAHLGEGRYRTAQRLVKEAIVRVPEHTGIRAMNRGLNEWKVRTRPASGQGRTEELEWLRNPPESARGKWAALVGSEMVTSAETLAEVMKSLKSMNLPKPPLVHRIA